MGQCVRLGLWVSGLELLQPRRCCRFAHLVKCTISVATESQIEAEFELPCHNRCSRVRSDESFKYQLVGNSKSNSRKALATDRKFERSTSTSKRFRSVLLLLLLVIDGPPPTTHHSENELYSAQTF